MLRIVPTGGVTPETAAAFLQAGSVALGAGSSLVSKEILQTRDWPALTQRAADFIAAVRKFRS
jgi:2-dehydro-3-deoxyphosphogluconate aldolase/(4S)-4-hydroxy-2-oxoglutarate aldolase